MKVASLLVGEHQPEVRLVARHQTQIDTSDGPAAAPLAVLINSSTAHSNRST